METIKLVSAELGDIVETLDGGEPSGRTYEVIDYIGGECHAYDLRYGHDLRVFLPLTLDVIVRGKRGES